MLNNLNILDRLDVTANILQILNYFENLRQTSNDRILKELQRQNTEYLEKIIKQNEEILRKIQSKGEV